MTYLESLFNTVASIELDTVSFLKYAALLCAGLLALGFLCRLLFGKRSDFNHALSSTVGILAVYVLGIFLYGTSTALSGLLASLPLVAVQDGKLALFVFQGASWTDICAMLVRMIVLAFLVNLVDTLLPKGKNFFLWLLLRLLTVLFAVFFQGVIVWLSETYLLEAFLSLAPMILIGILIAMLLLGALKLLVGIALATVNPIIGALYTFFFSSLVGRQLSKAVLTTLLLSALVYTLTHFGYYVMGLAGLSIVTLLPLILILLALWYLINQIL